jgi:WD40 repeat protein
MRVVDQVAFTPDGRRLMAAGSNAPDDRYKPDNRGIDVWDLHGGAEPTERLFADQLITGFVLNPAGRWLYVGTGFKYPDESTSRYWAVDLKRGEQYPLDLSGGNEFTLDIHPTGKWLVGFGHVTNWQTNQIVRWRQPTGGPPIKVWEYKHVPSRLYTRAIACDPKRTRFVTHDIESGRAVRDQVHELTIRAPETGELREKVPLPGRTVDQLLFSPDGSWFVIRAGRSLLVWKADDLTHKPQKIQGEGKVEFTGLAFHPSGRYLAATSNDRTVKIIDTSNWQVATTFAWDMGRMRSVAFSPDGALAAAGSRGGQVVLWDIDV